MSAYWNHNTAYHRRIERMVRRRGAVEVLDVGCGDGLLVQRLCAAGATAMGLEPDPVTAARARARLRGYARATVVEATFGDFDVGDRRFDLITSVASLHHMDLRRSLQKAAALLRPGGQLVVVGLARPAPGTCLPAPASRWPAPGTRRSATAGGDRPRCGPDAAGRRLGLAWGHTARTAYGRAPAPAGRTHYPPIRMKGTP